ncbi:nucleoside-triphosphatase [Paenibacillus methanolicus]|uniref:Nucleoside-triphosphatase n=1 Tax=Paenibacillus methanolicus TaxID=582686 RepID=A0A5S5C8H3_9BACL|nr:nucleoside-triphosphatase [Paenibacillus methanolicus]TYP75634.1 nucleoside-triphosphatase [Paenibacillus methanolicus]
MHTFLLTGKSQMGKTTLLKRIIDTVGAERFGGFYTEEIRDASERMGFTCVLLGGGSLPLAHVGLNSPHRVGRYGVRAGWFNEEVRRSLTETVDSGKIVVADEIGRMQMSDPDFLPFIQGLLASPEQGIVLGSIMEERDAATDALKALPGVRVLPVTWENRDRLHEEIAVEIAALLQTGN